MADPERFIADLLGFKPRDKEDSTLLRLMKEELSNGTDDLPLIADRANKNAGALSALLRGRQEQGN